MKSFILLSILGLTLARPQNEDLRDVLQEASDDIANAVMTKTGALNFMGGAAMDVTLNFTNSALDTISGIDFEGALNDTEDSLKDQKIAMIEALFDAKRQVIRALGNISRDQAEFVSQLYDSTVDQIDLAISATTSGLVLSKEFAYETAQNFSIEGTHNLTMNAIADFTDSVNEAINDAQDFIADTYDATTDAIQETGQSLIYAMLGVKQQLHEMAEDFNSQQGLNSGIYNIGVSINATMSTAESYAANTGVFNAMDNIVHSIGQLPLKINNFLAGTFGSTMVEEEELEVLEESEDIENEETLFESEENEVEAEVEPRGNINDENQGILKFLQKELKFWNRLSELL